MHIWKPDVRVNKLDVQETNLNLVIEVFHSSPNQPKKSKENVQGNLLCDAQSRKHTINQVKTPIQYNDLELCNVDCVSSNVKSFQRSD